MRKKDFRTSNQEFAVEGKIDLIPGSGAFKKWLKKKLDDPTGDKSKPDVNTMLINQMLTNQILLNQMPTSQTVEMEMQQLVQVAEQLVIN